MQDNQNEMLRLKDDAGQASQKNKNRRFADNSIVKFISQKFSETTQNEDDEAANHLKFMPRISVPVIKERLRWSSYIEYILSVLGFVIDLGNVWRFPTICYLNGGGAFLIPYFICLFVVGMPCMYLELALGQYFQAGNITIWRKVSPYMRGLGYSVIIINIYMLSYYMTIQAYALYYLFYSFRAVVPWTHCTHEWNTPNCVDFQASFLNANTNRTTRLAYNNSLSSTYEFFNRKLLGLHMSSGFDSLSGLKWDLVLSVFAILLLTSMCLVFGIKSSGKAVYVTAILPYACLIVLIAQSFTLDGAFDGLAYYLKPDFSKILDYKVWLAAAVQIFFSLGPGFGVLIAYSSYSPKSTNVQSMTIICSIVNALTSFLYGLVVFSGIGYMAKKLNTNITSFIQEGSGLVYIVYPEIIATFKHASIFAVIFFIMLISLGIDSAFGGLEGLYTAIADEYPFFKKHSYISRILISLVPFLTCLPTVTYGGIYVVQWLDTFSVSPCVIFVVFMELLAVCWFYGLDKFCQNVVEMNLVKPYWNWRVSWKYICPISLFTILIFSVLHFETIHLGTYEYPVWSSVLGWLLNVFALLPIPGFALYTYIKTKYKPTFIAKI